MKGELDSSLLGCGNSEGGDGFDNCCELGEIWIGFRVVNVRGESRGEREGGRGGGLGGARRGRALVYIRRRGLPATCAISKNNSARTLNA